MTTPAGELRPYVVTVSMVIRLHAVDHEAALNGAQLGVATGALQPEHRVEVYDQADHTVSTYLLMPNN